MDPKTTDPWWTRLFPDIRGWATIGAFALAFYALWLIANYPTLEHSELFKTAVILLLGTGGLGLVYSFLWGGSKASVAASDTVNEVAKQNAGAPSAQPQPVVVTNQAADPVPVESQEHGE